MSKDEITEETAREILRQGEQYLQSQLSFAIAADTRAATLMAVFTAAAIATLGFAFTQKADIFTAISAGITGLVLVAAAVFCVLSLLPVGVYVVGNEPKQWLETSAARAELAKALIDEAKNCQVRIDHNKRVLDRNASWFKRGAILGSAAPIIGLAIYLIGPIACRYADSVPLP